jgi:hypothetical protein
VLRLTVVLVALTGPGGHVVAINPEEVVSARSPGQGEFHESVQCVINTTDGKFVAVVETCKDALTKIFRAQERQPM